VVAADPLVGVQVEPSADRVALSVLVKALALEPVEVVVPESVALLLYDPVSLPVPLSPLEEVEPEPELVSP
jgi:hypothetical protein